MDDLIALLKIGKLIRESGHDTNQNFEAVYSALHKAGNNAVLDELDGVIREHFGRLRLPEKPTLYDCLILALRPKDAIVTFNWDPLICQAFKRWRHLGNVLPEVFFLHGNVDIGIDLEKKVSGFLSDEPYPGRKLSATPLLYPIEQKNYNSDPFVADQWQKASDWMSEAYYATIYGYSAPSSDVEARKLLLKAWTENPTRELAQFSIVDIRDANEVEKAWSDFIVRTHGGASDSFDYNILKRHPRRSCEAFAFATLQQAPWREDPFPDAKGLEDLEDWVRPLIDEEASGKLAGKPLH
jgi:hypothetical protein